MKTSARRKALLAAKAEARSKAIAIAKELEKQKLLEQAKEQEQLEKRKQRGLTNSKEPNDSFEADLGRKTDNLFAFSLFFPLFVFFVCFFFHFLSLYISDPLSLLS